MSQVGAAAAGRTDLPNKWAVLAGVGLGNFIGPMDISSVNLALPSLALAFNVPPSVIVWVTLVNTLTIAGSALTLGRLGDTLGRRQVYIYSFVVFTLGLTLCSLAQNLPQLLAFRVVESVGAAVHIANARPILVSAFPPQERGRALGIAVSIVGLGIMVGPVLSGFMLEWLDWRAVFYMRIPLGLLALALAIIFVKEPKRTPSSESFDLLGALVLPGGLTGLLVGLNQGPSLGWGSPPVVGLVSLGLLLLSFFFVVELRVAHPILELRLFRNRLFAASCASFFFYFASGVVVDFLLPFYLIRGLALPFSRAGFLAALAPLMMLTLSPLSGWLSDRVESRLICTAGLLGLGAGVFFLSLQDPSATLVTLVAALVVLGIGQAVFQSPNQSCVLGSVPSDRLGTASAVIATMRTVSSSCALALASALFTSRQLFYASALSGSANGNLAVVKGVQETLLLALALVALGVLVSSLRGKGR